MKEGERARTLMNFGLGTEGDLKTTEDFSIGYTFINIIRKNLL